MTFLLLYMVNTVAETQMPEQPKHRYSLQPDKWLQGCPAGPKLPQPSLIGGYTHPLNNRRRGGTSTRRDRLSKLGVPKH